MKSLERYLLLAILIVGLVVSNYFMLNTISRLKDELHRSESILNNNLLASMDSLKVHVSTLGNQEYEQLGYIYDLTQKSDNLLRQTLKDQGYQLAAIQEISLKINDIELMANNGYVISDSTHVIYEFPPQDTLLVSIAGKTIINLKEHALSYTNLKVKFKPIEGITKISKNPETNQLIGSFEPLMKGLSITNLRTEIDPSLTNIYIKEGTFWDKLQIGVLAGGWQLNNNLSSELGLTVQYGNYGCYYMATDGQGRHMGVSYSTSVSSIFK